ncbi:hypothetical protein FSP39_005317 [Pinctada imbricata]|uniref:SWIM-type domain-containing protein n=1 Tax=Pinctada imbricata TaxID=66713 RepID=A0AA88YVS5_PINIB|nr:hypothetical protein FSP39_005317 [Pinctada imbricata]
MCEKETPKAIHDKIDYVDGLDRASRERYNSKLKLINALDPCKLTTKDWGCEAEKFPEIAYPDIVNYLVYTQSAYTLDDLKVYKSLESYNQFVCGWVKDVLVKEINIKSVITGRHKIDNSENQKPKAYKIRIKEEPKIIAERDGAILTGHCDCMAGLGEVCSHVGALLFYVDALVKLRNSKTVTREPTYWMLPSGFRKVEHAMLGDINFKSAKSLRKDLNDNIDNVLISRRSSSSQHLPTIPIPSDSKINYFYRRLHNTKGKPVILSLTEQYSPLYVPTC